MARKIRPEGAGPGDLGDLGDLGEMGDDLERHHVPQGRWRSPAVRPTRAPHGEVKWWERPAPEESDPALWQAVQRIQARRQQLAMSVTELARRLSSAGHEIRRETLSRVLNGKQPTTWATAERLAFILGMTLELPNEERAEIDVTEPRVDDRE